MNLERASTCFLEKFAEGLTYMNLKLFIKLENFGKI